MMRARFGVLVLGCLVGGCSDGPAPPVDAWPVTRVWSVLREGLDRVPLCVWGSAPDDVWVGGGGLKSVAKTLLLHGPPEALTEVPLPYGATIWWIHGVGADDAWAVGEHGLALHWDGATWTPTDARTTATLYGVYAAAPGDVWAVGGDPTGHEPDDVLLHFDGIKWAPVAPPSLYGVTYFKVWGSSATDVHVVGQAGRALHYDGASWAEVPSGTDTTIFTVHGAAPDRAFAIGGPPATLLQWDRAGAWQPVAVPPEMSGTMTGVFADASGVVFVTGERGQKFVRDGSGDFHDGTDQEPTPADLHAVWGDGAGNAIAVGGNYVALSAPGVVPSGVVLRYHAKDP